jgi:Reverse transcriptase (RNA-dependent DNA polymerase)
MQIPGLDYTESFSPVASDTAIRVFIGIFLYYQKHCPKEKWKLEMFDVEAAFLNADLDMKCLLEWQEGMQEFGFITGTEKQKYCIELKKAMYGNIDSPLRWMKTFTGYLKINLKLQQSETDPCILFKHDKKGKLVLVIAVYVDDTLCAGTEDTLKWMYKKMKERLNIEELGDLKKLLGIWWTWHKDKNNEIYLKATMPKMVKEIQENLRWQQRRNRRLQQHQVFPIRC